MERKKQKAHVGREESDSSLFSPSWIPQEVFHILEPTPIRDSASGMSIVNSKSLDDFETFFQKHVAPRLSVTASQDGGLKDQSSDSALERILDLLVDPSEPTLKESCPRSTTSDLAGKKKGHTSRPAMFPMKLHDMMEYCEENDLGHVVSWEMAGRAFRIRSIARFQSQVMGKFFKLTKFESLQRQLHLYSFKRISKGPQKGSYTHPLFIRGRRDLSKSIRRDVSAHDSPTSSSQEYTSNKWQGNQARIMLRDSPSSAAGAGLPLLEDLSNLEDDEMSNIEATVPIVPHPASITRNTVPAGPSHTVSGLSTVSAEQPISGGPQWHFGMDSHAYVTDPLLVMPISTFCETSIHRNDHRPCVLGFSPTFDDF